MPASDLLARHKARVSQTKLPSAQKTAAMNAAQEPISVSGNRWPMVIRWPEDTPVAVYSSLDDNRYSAKRETDGRWVVTYPAPWHLFVSLITVPGWVPTEQDCIDADIDVRFLEDYRGAAKSMVVSGEVLNIAPPPDVSNEDI